MLTEKEVIQEFKALVKLSLDVKPECRAEFINDGRNDLYTRGGYVDGENFKVPFDVAVETITPMDVIED